MEQHQIGREVFVRLDRCIQADVLNHLAHQPPNAPNPPNTANPNTPNAPTVTNNLSPSVHQRRASVAATNLFLVGRGVRETGFDYLQRIPRNNTVNLGASTSQATVESIPSIATADGNDEVDGVDGEDREDPIQNVSGDSWQVAEVFDETNELLFFDFLGEFGAEVEFLYDDVDEIREFLTVESVGQNE